LIIYEQMLKEEYMKNKRNSMKPVSTFDFRTITSCVSQNVNLIAKGMTGNSGDKPDFLALDDELLNNQEAPLSDRLTYQQQNQNEYKKLL
jgi:hypothetical protein